MRYWADPVEETTTSASAIASTNRSISTARPPVLSASRSPRARVRFATRRPPTPRRAAVVGGQAGHAAGADDEHRAAVEVAEQPLRLVESGLDQGAADRVDRRLVVSALADPKCLLQKGVQRLSDGARALAGPERVAELAEDLRLADRHRVEPGGHREGVGDGAVLEVHVEVSGQLGPVHAADVRERLSDRGDRPVEGERFRIHLEAVARAEDDRLPDRVGGRDPVRESARGRARDSLEQGDRRGAVGQADDEQTHRATPTGW